jgi:hypothetical protein
MALDVHRSAAMDLIDERDDTKIWVIAAGALAGALAGYVLMTSRGRRALGEAVETLDEFATTCARFSQAFGRAHVAASDSWHAVVGAVTPTRSR